MTDKELQRLGRKELLEILLAQSRQIDALKAEVEQTRQQLEDRKLILNEADMIAGVVQKLDQGTDSVTAAAEYLRQEAEGITKATEALNQLLESAKATFEQCPDEPQTSGGRWEPDWWETERRERERQDAERRERERQEAERREWERQDAERRERERQDAERREWERQDAERREWERQEAERRERERRDYERWEADYRERERREADRDWSRGPLSDPYATQRRDKGKPSVKVRMHRKGGEVSGK